MTALHYLSSNLHKNSKHLNRHYLYKSLKALCVSGIILRSWKSMCVLILAYSALLLALLDNTMYYLQSAILSVQIIVWPIWTHFENCTILKLTWPTKHEPLQNSISVYDIGKNCNKVMTVYKHRPLQTLNLSKSPSCHHDLYILYYFLPFTMVRLITSYVDVVQCLSSEFHVVLVVVFSVIWFVSDTIFIAII